MSSENKYSPDRDDVIYAVYLTLHAARTLFPQKTLRVAISELMYADPFAWRAVGITRAALDAYLQAGKKRIKGIQRAHLTDRKEMVDHVLDRDEPLSQEALFSYWRETDRSVISLTSENLKNSLGNWIPFDNREAKYFPSAAIGFKFRDVFEGNLLRQLAEQLSGE